MVLAVSLAIGPAATAQESWGDWGEWEEGDSSAGNAESADGSDAGGSGFSGGLGSAAAFGSRPFSIYGYVETSATSRFDDAGEKSPTVGAATRTRVKAEWKPQEEITARLEAIHSYRTGFTNETVVASQYGIAPPGSQAGDPNDDYLSSFEIDHAWADVNLGTIDLYLGKFPIAWGSGYLFNPTDHLNAAGALEGREAETAGTVAISPTAYIGTWALGGYLAFEQKGAEAFALKGSADPDNLPFGLRLRGYLAGFDLTLSAAKEVRYVGVPGGELPDGSGGWTESERYERNHYLGLDVIGSIGDFGVYLEGSVQAPQEGNEVNFGAKYSLEESLHTAVGVEYTFADGWSGGGLSLKAEYAHLGGGTTDKEEYTLETLLEGSAITLAEDYLFLYANQTYVSFLELTLASLVNLNDGSFVLFPEAGYSFHENFEGTLGVTLPLGEPGSEYDGRIVGTSVDIYEPEVSITFKASF